MGSTEKYILVSTTRLLSHIFVLFKRSLNKIIWRPSWICGIKKSTDIMYDHLDNLLVLQNIGRDTKIHILIAKVRNWGIPLVIFQTMALHGVTLN